MPSGRSGERVALGFDYGRRRIGVAVGQELTQSAQPLTIINTATSPWAAIDKLVTQWAPGLFVVGVPYHADESANAVTRQALAFGQRLSARYGLPLETVDERLSSAAALALLAEYPRRRRTDPIDDLAATVILQSWLRQQPAP